MEFSKNCECKFQHVPFVALMPNANADNANNSTFITLCVLIRIRYFGGHTQMRCTFLPKRGKLVHIKSLLSVPSAHCFAFSDPTQP